jgi:D-proline reductase (dithiol) PrdB
MSHVKYIDKTAAYYQGEGYEKPYAWAHYDNAPFTPLKKPLSECKVALLSTSEVAAHYDPGVEDNPIVEEGFRAIYPIPSDIPTDRLYSRADAYDAYATHLDDINSFFPAERMHEALAAGRIGCMPERFYGAYNNYSQRKVLEEEAPKVLEYCRADNIDVAITVPV